MVPATERAWWDMAPMVSIDLGAADSAALMRIAHASVTQGLRLKKPPAQPAEPLSGALAEPGASFVSLYRHGDLRGCVGSLSPCRALGFDVLHNAYGAAFHDIRFPPLAASELAELSLAITLIGPMTPIAVTDEQSLLATLRPGIDGVVLEGHGRRATFLPAVWEQLPAPRAFLRHLKHKAGFPPEFWSPGLSFQRYETVTLA